MFGHRPREVAEGAARNERFALQIELKPTEGFEPSTPALRERCSGQLSYVGVRGECSRGLVRRGRPRRGVHASRSRAKLSL